MVRERRKRAECSVPPWSGHLSWGPEAVGSGWNGVCEVARDQVTHLTDHGNIRVIESVQPGVNDKELICVCVTTGDGDSTVGVECPDLRLHHLNLWEGRDSQSETRREKITYCRILTESHLFEETWHLFLTNK